MSTVPFAPLTYAELNTRSAAAREWCGFTAIAALEVGGFDVWTIQRLTESATLARDYQAAAMVRVVRA